MPILTDPITAATDLGDVDLWNLLIDAANRRALAVLPGATPVPNVSAGDDLFDGHYSGGFPVGVLVALQTRVWDMATSFLDTSVAYEGETTESPAPFLHYDNETIRVAAGLPQTIYFSNNGAGSFPHFGPGVVSPIYSHLRRQRYRQIAGTDAQYDVWGNEAVTGQRAYLCSTPPGPTASATAVQPYVGTRYSGTRWRCVTPGDWVRDETAPADLLDNTLAPPNCCGYDSAWDTFGVGATSPNTSGRGTLQPSDVVSYLLLEELRLYLLAMRDTLGFVSVGSGHYWEATAFGTDSSEAGAKSAALAAYAASAGDVAGSVSAVLVNSTLGDDGAGNWYADLTRHKTSLVVNGLDTTLEKSGHWFVFGGRVSDQSGSNTWDANGDPVVEGEWHEWATTAATLSGTLSETFGADPATNPPAWPATPAGGLTNVRGYHGRGLCCVIRWAF